jgi:arylsulfatase A-like enzyme/DNA-binding SARP family transcriptional activator
VDDVRRAGAGGRGAREAAIGTTEVKRVLPLVAVAAAIALLFALNRFRPGGSTAPASTASSSPVDSRKPRNVLLITLDTMRADHLGAYGYAAARTPNLDALARDGVRFDDATAPAPITGPSHAGILTGVHPARLGVRDNVITPLPAAATTLAEILQARGFATGGFVGAFILDRPYGFAQGFDTFGGFNRVDSGSEANAERTGDAVVDDARQWIAGLDVSKPFFGWIHLYDAHLRYQPPAPFEHTYDGEVAFVDQQVGRLLGSLRERNALDDTLIVAIGDHGESLGEHGEEGHGIFVYDAVLRVPFIVSGPGTRRGATVAEQVRAIDLLPTIFDLLAVPADQKIDGVSLAALLRGERRESPPPSYAESYYPRFHYGWSELRAIRADGWKAIDAPKRELYNLRQDPGERKNLYAEQQPLADRMLGELARTAREMSGGDQTVVRQPDREAMERLRSLGYVGGSTALPGSRRGPDPKDRIAGQSQYNTLMSEAIEDLRGGRPQASIPKFKRLVAMNDRAYDLHLFLGEAYERLNQPRPALGEYEYAAMLNRESVLPVVSAAEVHLKAGDLRGARKKLEEATKIEPAALDVLLLTGRILDREGRGAEALAAFEKAAAANGANPRGHTQLVSVAMRLQRWDLAEQHLRKLLDMGYQPSRTYLALGRVAQVRGRNADAIANYREALRLEPGLQPAEAGLRSLGIR